MSTVDERQEWVESLGPILEDSLAWQPFTTNPVLVAGDIAFPASLSRDADHLGWALLFLLDHVGLSDTGITLEAWTLDPDGTVPSAQPFEPIDADTRLAYAGTTHGSSLVIYDPAKLDRPENVLGAAALVVAEIYRDLRGLAPESQAAGHTVDDELYALCLGFGVLLANASLHIEHASGGHGRAVTHTSKTGVLGPYRLGQLLAVQLKARHESDAAVGRVREALDNDARGAFDAALDDLTAAEIDRLGLPSRSMWPSSLLAVHGEVDLGRLRVSRDGARHLQATSVARGERNRGQAIFGVHKRRDVLGMFVGGVVGAILLGLLGAAGFPSVGAAVGIASVIVGGVLGFRREYHECSDADCRGRIEEGDETCPECGGIVAGQIEDEGDRLVAQERWLEEQGLESLDELPDKSPEPQTTPNDWW